MRLTRLLTILMMVAGFLGIRPPMLWAKGEDQGSHTKQTIELQMDRNGLVEFPHGSSCNILHGLDFSVYWGIRLPSPPVYVSPDRKHLAVGPLQLERSDDPNPPPWLTVLRAPRWHHVILIEEVPSCKLVRILPVDPGGASRADDVKVRFSEEGQLLMVDYGRWLSGLHPRTLIYSAPGFADPPLEVPLSMEGLTAFPNGYYVAHGLVDFKTISQLVFRAHDGRINLVCAIPFGEWDKFRDWPWGHPLFADGEAVAILMPIHTAGNELPFVFAGRYAGGPRVAVKKELPRGAVGVEVSRGEGGKLRLSYTVDGRKRVELIEFPAVKAKEKRRANFCARLFKWPDWRIARDGTLSRLSDGKVCDYTLKPDGTRYRFLSYELGMKLTSSPDGRYLAIKGALDPEDNPNPKSVPCDRPGYYGKEYDSVYLVVDTRTCRVVNVVNIPPAGRTEGMGAAFSSDDTYLALVGGRGEYNFWLYKTVGFGAAPVAKHYSGMLVPLERLVYVDLGHEVLAVLGCRAKNEVCTGQVLTVSSLIGSSLEGPGFASVNLPARAEDVAVRRDKHGRLVYSYRAGGKKMLKRFPKLKPLTVP